MIVIAVLFTSLILQIIAVFAALRLMKTVGGRAIWIALSSAMLLMSVRRAISLSHAINQYPNPRTSLDAELVALLISILVLATIFLFKPLIERIRQADQKLDEQLHRNRLILQTSPEGFLTCDMHGNIQEVNHTFSTMAGYQSNDILHRNIYDILIIDTPMETESWLERFPQEGVWRMEGKILLRHNKSLDIAITAKHADFAGDKFVYIFVRDISARNKAKTDLALQKERAQVTLESIGDGVITTDAKGNILYMNPVAESLIYSTPENACGKTFTDVVKLVAESRPNEIIDPTEICIRNNRHYTFSDHILLAAGGDGAHFVKVVVAPLHDEQKLAIGSVTVIHNVSELKYLSNNLSYQATHDALTGLYNRRQFENRLEAALASAANNAHEHAMCYMDLDQFKIINDSCGHIAGDELLKQLAIRLQGAVRETDTLARLGGDEFGILLESCHLEHARRVVDNVFDTVEKFRFHWHERIFEIGLSIGLVPITKNSGNLTDILSAADSACYIAKEKGRNRVHVAVENDNDLRQRKSQMEQLQKLKYALNEDRFELHGQSVKPLGANTYPWHTEILLRMIGADGKLILPDEFLPVAERYNMMPAIDQWVVTNVFRWLELNPIGALDHQDVLAINLSGQSLGEKRFLDFVLSQLDKHSVSGDRICFEITETAVISNITYAGNFIDTLKAKGCKFSLDDFGSGLSSFKYLKDLNVDFLKIDGSFIRSMASDEKTYDMVVSINEIGHIMGLKTIAEHVENAELQALLETVGVDFIQGYIVDKPYPIGKRRSSKNNIIAYNTKKRT